MLPTINDVESARGAIAFIAENLEPCVETGHWSLPDVRAMLEQAVALLEPAGE